MLARILCDVVSVRMSRNLEIVEQYILYRQNSDLRFPMRELGGPTGLSSRRRRVHSQIRQDGTTWENRRSPIGPHSCTRGGNAPTIEG